MDFRALFLAIVILTGASASADEYRSKANDGYDYYKNGEYDKALEYYRQAGILKPDQALPRMGKGASLYRSNDLEGAESEFESAASAGDKKAAADMNYNIGNIRYRAEDYEGAVESYIKALKINPQDPDYKRNLELALSRLQQQQQNEEKNQKGDKGDKDRNEDQQDKNRQGQNEQEDKSDQEQAESDRDKDKSRQDMARSGGMSQEEAENLLARFEEDEKEIQKQLRQVRVQGSSRYDW